MTFTNSQYFPQVFQDALAGLEDADKTERSGFDYSATTLIRSPREVHLCKRHKTTRDMFREWYSFIGTAFHERLEQGLKKNKQYLLEQRFLREEEIELNGKMYKCTVGFKPDNYYYTDGVLYDYKITTSYMHGLEAKPEWEQQLNLYARELELNNLPVKKIVVVVIYRDWRESSGRYKALGDYPVSPMQEFFCPVWSKEKRDEFYYNRLKLILKYEDTPDDELPLCSSEEMWEKESTFAVYRTGATKAIRLLPTMELCKEYIKDKKLVGVSVEHRPGQRTKCQMYCDAAPHCNQYQEWLKSQESKDIDALQFS